jgi:hypothetical protein
LEVHLVELPKYHGAPADLPNARPIERWAYFFRHAASMSLAEIGQCFGEAAFVEAGGVLEMIAKTPEERLRYEFRQKRIHDEATNLKALEAAKLEGLAKGRVEGRLEGEWIGQIRLLQQILGEPVTPSPELASWEVDRLQSMAESLQARLRGRS